MHITVTLGMAKRNENSHMVVSLNPHLMDFGDYSFVTIFSSVLPNVPVHYQCRGNLGPLLHCTYVALKNTFLP